MLYFKNKYNHKLTTEVCNQNSMDLKIQFLSLNLTSFKPLDTMIKSMVGQY